VIGPKVIKTATVAIRVGRGKLESAVQSTVAAAAGHNGYVVSTEVEGIHSNAGTVVIRVPSDRFETALAVIKDLGAVTRETVTGNDVTQQFIDLGARLRNFSAQERVMLNLMRRASTIDDTIRVEQQLQGVQLEIERIKGRMRYLRSQASFSTITASFAESGAVVTTGRPGTVARAWQKAGDVLLSVVSGVIVGAAVVIPIALLALLALLGFKIVRPKLGSTT
jgi:hypothetical protein